MKYYFAYGSNMNPNRMEERGAYFRSYRRAVLKGYKLRFNKRSIKGFGCANIEPAENQVVEGVLYELENPEEAINELDYYEGYPSHYGRKVLTVVTEDGEEVDAIVYIANPEVVDDSLKPTKNYLSNLLKACEMGILSEEYCEKLRKVETVD